jgi:hypothetical protein
VKHVIHINPSRSRNHLCGVPFLNLSVIDSSLTRSTLGPYLEKSNFYLNDNAALREERTVEELLAWLNYPGMHQRCETVEEAHKNTFRWIFETRRTNAENTAGSRHLLTSGSTGSADTGFVTWLREETGVFWICGKPGAGKSTLMKYIMGDPRLKEHARVWVGSHQLSTSSFYFWKHGSEIQKSLCGLYRALLWQILNDDLTLARKAFPTWQTSFSTTEPKLDALRAALDRMIKACVLRKKHLILIDGLDEYEDEGRDNSTSEEGLSQDILRMVESGSVKIIIASRPHRVFRSYFSHGRKLAIHELTTRDLGLFAHDRLLNDETIRPLGESLSAEEIEQLQRLVVEIVGRSCGVFLWARIVVDLARVHIRDYNDLDQLETILAKLHRGIEDLFDQIMEMIFNLKGPGKIEGLRYLKLTSHWFDTTWIQSSHWLPISILGVGCELRSPIVTESWLRDNAKRLAAIGHNEARAEGRVESHCFGLLEVSTIKEGDMGAFAPNPIRRVIRPLHRTLREYLSRHDAIQSAKDLSLPDHESFNADTAILLGLVVMEEHIYPLLALRSGSSFTPGLLDNVMIFNKLAEEATGGAQVALLSALDRIVEAGFTALVERYCYRDHRHKARCATPRHDVRGLSQIDLSRAQAFQTLVFNFALNPSRPLISRDSCSEGFLDMLAITIACDSNAPLQHWISTTFLNGAPSQAIISARAARLLDHALNKTGVFLPGMSTFVAETNLEGLQWLLQIGASPDIRIDGASAWENFLDNMLSHTNRYARNHVAQETHDGSWQLEALPALYSHGVRQRVYRIRAVMLEEPGQPLSRFDLEPDEGGIVEFRRYSAIQIVRQTASILHHEHSAARNNCQAADEPHREEITHLEKMQHHLEKQNAISVPSPECSWSDLKRAGYMLEYRDDTSKDPREALSTAHRTGSDTAQYQQIYLSSDEDAIATWLPRETHELPNNRVPNVAQLWMDRLTLQDDGQLDFDVVGWLVVEKPNRFYLSESN